MRGNHLIRECRLRAGVTQTELAGRVGTTQPALARLERGQGNPTMKRLTDIARACGFDIRVTIASIDDTEWDMVADSLRLAPAERVAKAVGAARLALALAAAGATARSACAGRE